MSLFPFSLLVGSICWHPYCLLEHKNVELCFDHVSECSINMLTSIHVQDYITKTALLSYPLIQDCACVRSRG